MLGQANRSGSLLVAFGDFKIYVSPEDLEAVNGKQTPPERLQVHVPVPTGIRSEIDLRGMRVEEALPVVDKFLSDAVLAGLHEVKMIHGMGTGILRKNVVSFLKEHPLVAGTVADEPEQVNPGVTVVALVKSE